MKIGTGLKGENRRYPLVYEHRGWVRVVDEKK